MECPCDLCLTRSMCGDKVCKNGYLVIEWVRKCPMANKYLNSIHERKLRGRYYYTKIYDICNVFKVHRNFVWHASSVL